VKEVIWKLSALQCGSYPPILEQYIAVANLYWKAVSCNDKLRTRRAVVRRITLRYIFQSNTRSFWTYGMQPWGTASTPNMETLERFQCKALNMIVEVPLYLPNTDVRRKFQTPTAKEEILHYNSQCSARLSIQTNDPVVKLIAQPDNNRRLRRHLRNDLPIRFLV
jgi:hypothetical protein